MLSNHQGHAFTEIIFATHGDGELAIVQFKGIVAILGLRKDFLVYDALGMDGWVWEDINVFIIFH